MRMNDGKRGLNGGGGGGEETCESFNYGLTKSLSSKCFSNWPRKFNFNNETEQRSKKGSLDHHKTEIKRAHEHVIFSFPSKSPNNVSLFSYAGKCTACKAISDTICFY